MSERKWTSCWNDMLICGLCQKILTDNRRLSCMHAFCRKCLEEAKRRKPKSKKIKCKMCEKETVLPKGRVANLSKNSFLEKLVYRNSLKNEISFTSCETCPDSKTSQATRYCYVCYQNMCDACDNQHKKIKATKNHQVVHLRSDEHYEAMMKKPEVCFQHDTEIDLICIDCKQAICSACLKAGHEFHKIQDIDGVAENIRRILHPYVEYMNERIIRERVLLEELRQEVFEYDKEVNLEKQRVSDVAKSLIQRIKSVESELTAQLKATSENVTQRFNISRTALEYDIRRLDMHRIYLEQLLTIGSSLDLYQDEKLGDYCRTLISSHVPNKSFQHFALHKEKELRDYFVTAILEEQFNSNSAKCLPKINEFYGISRPEETAKNDVQAYQIVTALYKDGTSSRKDSRGSNIESSERSICNYAKTAPVAHLAKKEVPETPKIDDSTLPLCGKQTSPLGMKDSLSSSINPKSVLEQCDMTPANLQTNTEERQRKSKQTDTTRKPMQNNPTFKVVEDMSNECKIHPEMIKKYYSHNSFFYRENLGDVITLPSHTSLASEISSNDLFMKFTKTAKRSLSSLPSGASETCSHPNEIEETTPARGRVRNLVKNIDENNSATLKSTKADEQSTKETLQSPKLLEQQTIKLDIDKAVAGVAASDKMVFVLQEFTPEIHVFSLTTGKRENPIFVTNMANPRDIAICTYHMCLYISDWSTFKLYRIDLKNNNAHSWSCDYDYGSLSVTINYHVLLARHKTGKFIEYDTNGILIKTVNIRHSDFMQINPWHVMQLMANKFVVSFADEQSGIHGLLLTDSNGTAVRTLKGREFEEQTNSKVIWNRTKLEEQKRHGSSFSGIYHLAVSRKQQILAIDCNNSRLLLLNNQLEIHQELISSKFLDRPNRMFLDETNGRLYVADNQLINRRPRNGQIKVFDIRECNL